MHILIHEIKYLINSDDYGGFSSYLPVIIFFFLSKRAFKGVRMENYKFRYRGIGM